VILDVYRERFHTRIKARSLGHGPTFQDTAKFQPEIIVEMAGSVLLDEIPCAALYWRVARRLIRTLKISLAAILFQTHV
jgi:hypothetical protein